MYSLDINFLKDRDTRIFDTKPQPVSYTHLTLPTKA